MRLFGHLLYPCVRTNYEYCTHIGGGVFICSLPFDLTGSIHTLPGVLSSTGGTKTGEEVVSGGSLIANFRECWPYFHVNIVERSCRKTFINNLRENDIKIGKNK